MLAGICVLVLAASASASPYSARRVKRQASASTNDVICESLDYNGNTQYPPPVVVQISPGVSSCECENDMGGNATYTVCNAINPPFGQNGYSDAGLRQNLCSLDANQVAQCGTTCTPNTKPDGNGNCEPANPNSYVLQSPTTRYSSETSAFQGFTGSVITEAETTAFTSTSIPSTSSPANNPATGGTFSDTLYLGPSSATEDPDETSISTPAPTTTGTSPFTQPAQTTFQTSTTPAAGSLPATSNSPGASTPTTASTSSSSSTSSSTSASSTLSTSKTSSGLELRVAKAIGWIPLLLLWLAV